MECVSDFLYKLNAIIRNSAARYVLPEMHNFTLDSVRVVPYKDVTFWGSRCKI